MMETNSLFGMQVGSALRLGACAAALHSVLALGCVAPPEEMSEGDVEAEATEAQDDALVAGAGVSSHGWLKTVGNQIQDKNGAQVQLKGMSLFWSQWAGSFYNASVVNSLADNWNSNLVRAAMGIESGGYLTNPAAEKARVKTIVDAAIAKDIYVIIDWHDHNATQHTQQAVSFFTEMANLYKTKPNVIFEIFNEPDNETWPEVKSYAQQVISAIRGTGSQNLIVVGTPTWSQDVDVAANNPITGYANIAYTLHFYAGTHKQSLRDKATTALSKGLPLFVTEFGTCDASGNGGLDLNESQTWMNFLNQNKISWANWSLFDKNETASALVPGSSTTGAWTDASLTQSGAWVKQKLLEGSGVNPPPPPPPPPPGAFQFVVSPNINPWWIQVKVTEQGHTITSVTANAAGNVYPLTLQTWGEWTTSPPAAIPGGTLVVFTAKDESNNTGTFTSQPWPQ
jgi:endoglucanase